jgi:hypothetical protein
MLTHLYYFPAGEILESISCLFIYQILGGLFVCQIVPTFIYCVVL